MLCKIKTSIEALFTTWVAVIYVSDFVFFTACIAWSVCVMVYMMVDYSSVYWLHMRNYMVYFSMTNSFTWAFIDWFTCFFLKCCSHCWSLFYAAIRSIHKKYTILSSVFYVILGFWLCSLPIRYLLVRLPYLFF